MVKSLVSFINSLLFLFVKHHKQRIDQNREKIENDRLKREQNLNMQMKKNKNLREKLALKKNKQFKNQAKLREEKVLSKQRERERKHRGKKRTFFFFQLLLFFPLLWRDRRVFFCNIADLIDRKSHIFFDIPG